MNVLDSLVCEGVQIPVTHYDGNLLSGTHGVNIPEEVSLPRVDIYKFDTEYEVHAWAIKERDMFEIIEQIMLRFNPYTSNHSFQLIETNKEQHGPVCEFIAKVRNV